MRGSVVGICAKATGVAVEESVVANLRWADSDGGGLWAEIRTTE